jgi:hypothetical protein
MCPHTEGTAYKGGRQRRAVGRCSLTHTQSASVIVSTPSVHAQPLLPKNSQLHRPAAVLVQHDGQAHGLAIAHHQCNTQQPAVTCVHHCTQRGAATRRHLAADRRPGGHAAAPAALACSCAVHAPLPAACRARRGGARSLVRRLCGRWTRLAAWLTQIAAVSECIYSDAAQGCFTPLSLNGATPTRRSCSTHVTAHSAVRGTVAPRKQGRSKGAPCRGAGPEAGAR